MGLTRIEYELQKETLESDIRGIQIQQLERKKTIEELKLEALDHDVTGARHDVRKHLAIAQGKEVDADIAEQKLEQLKDALTYEKYMTNLHKGQLVLQGQSALLKLQEAQEQLDEGAAIFQARYGKALDLSNLPL